MALSDVISAADTENTINIAWDNIANITPATQGATRIAVLRAMKLMDDGVVKVAEKRPDGTWRINQWCKKAILLYFRLNEMEEISNGPGGTIWWDKVPSKFAGWGYRQFQNAGFRAVPNCTVRYSAHIGENVILMPSFVNVGANIGDGTMIDSWVTVGSCAQIGRNCHISSTVGIGGVLEPLQANPVIIEDNAFIGIGSQVAEGMHIEEGAVLSMGVFIGASTKIIDRETGEITYGRVPAYSVVVPGTIPGAPLPDGSPGPNLACAVIVKRVDARTRSKTSINDLLRDEVTLRDSYSKH